MKRIFSLMATILPTSMATTILTVLLVFFSAVPVVYAEATVSAEATVRVAVIDTGVAASVVNNVTEGYNYMLQSTDTDDLIGHGTAVASLISGSKMAGLGDENSRIVIVPLTYYTKNTEGTMLNGGGDAITKAIYDAIDRYGCKVINISSGTYVELLALKEAVEYAESKNVIVVSSAGNWQEELPNLIYYPSGYETVVSVGACDKYGDEAEFSQKNDSVDILAQGTSLKAASLRGRTRIVEGTSYATALVTEKVCRILEEYPDLSAAKVREMLFSRARTVGGNLVLADFKDVTEDDFFYEAVRYAVERGITKGTSEYLFSPKKVCTKGEILTFMWRNAGSPGEESAEKGEHFYSGALKWAENFGINSVEPMEPCTRLDTVRFLYSIYGSEEATADDRFVDVRDEAVTWACQKGITNGTSESTFSPEKLCSRGEIVTFLFRAFEIA